MSAAAAPAIKLTYFPILGRAFPIRTALGAAGLAYEDERITGETLAERRGTAGYSDAVPLGQLPVISIDGKVFTQSWAILRWAGKKGDLYPRDDDLLALTIDEVIAVVDELYSKVPQDADPEAKKAKREEFASKVAPKYINLIAKKIAESGGPFVTGKELTIADLVVFGILHNIKSGILDHVPTTFFAPWPAVDALYDAIKSHPTVKAHGKIPA